MAITKEPACPLAFRFADEKVCAMWDGLGAAACYKPVNPTERCAGKRLAQVRRRFLFSRLVCNPQILAMRAAEGTSLQVSEYSRL